MTPQELKQLIESDAEVTRLMEQGNDLQRVGIFQSGRHHNLHHGSPFEVRYCVMTNYLNWILDEACFWRALEYIGFIVTGLRPRENHARTN